MCEMCDMAKRDRMNRAMRLIHEIQELSEGRIPSGVELSPTYATMTEQEQREMRLEFIAVNAGLALAMYRETAPSIELGSLAGMSLGIEVEEFMAQAERAARRSENAPNN